MPSSTLEPGFRLGKYQVLAHIATGGMGSVYKAFDVELRRTVALKVLAAQLSHREQDLERFRREARVAARLSHKHIVTLFECGYDLDHNLHYLAMEFIDGIDLAQYIERLGRLQPEEARRILLQAAKALEHAFAQGVVHRDIKPSNFLLAQVDKKMVVKLTDLGLALVHDDDDFKVTRSGSTVGTLDYMSPEQARDSRATDIRSDIYSLGCTAFHMLAGRPPFFEGGLGERVYKHMQEAPPDVRQFNPTVARGFWAILEKMLAKKPSDRYATPSELLADLQSTPAEASAEVPTLASGQVRSGRRQTAVPSVPPSRPSVAAPTPVAASSSDESVVPAETAPRKSRPRPQAAPTKPSSSGETATPLVAPDQARAAAAFHDRALEVLAEGGGEDYMRELLANSLKMDPFNLKYRKTLREVNKKASGSLLGRLFGSLNVLAIKSKMRQARSGGDIRKVLEHGEEILARQPADVDTHIEMAGAADELGMRDLALWFLEQGREQAPESTNLMRALARLYERHKDWKGALALWEKVRKLEPNDAEARGKINELSVEDHLARGKYRK